jgi:uncharacterized protein YdaU (DUF1376 family)
LHYYKFHIGDYSAHTGHLEPLEDLAYRRMIDWCFLHERPLPNDIEQIGKLIRMRSHCDCIATVLREFFTLTETAGWWQNRIGEELASYQEKSKKSAASANARWAKEKVDANALPTECERNANHKPLTINQEPLTTNQKKKRTATVVATPDGVSQEVFESFLVLRKAKNAPVTLTAIQGIGKEARIAGLSLEEALAMCCARGWTGFKAKWTIDQVNAADSRQATMTALTRGLSTPKPFWATETIEVQNERLL